MVLRYLSNCVARAKEGPKHPLYYRTFDVHGELIAAKSYDDTSFDQNGNQKCLPVSDQISAGMRLKPMGHAPSQSMLNDAIIADEFVKRFHAAASIPSSPAPAPAESAAPAPAEPVATE